MATKQCVTSGRPRLLTRHIACGYLNNAIRIIIQVFPDKVNNVHLPLVQ